MSHLSVSYENSVCIRLPEREVRVDVAGNYAGGTEVSQSRLRVAPGPELPDLRRKPRINKINARVSRWHERMTLGRRKGVSMNNATATFR